MRAYIWKQGPAIVLAQMSQGRFWTTRLDGAAAMPWENQLHRKVSAGLPDGLYTATVVGVGGGVATSVGRLVKGGPLEEAERLRNLNVGLREFQSASPGITGFQQRAEASLSASKNRGKENDLAAAWLSTLATRARNPHSEDGVKVATWADTAVVAVFNELAEAQRGEPEAAMERLQYAIGGGEYSWCVEHVGDLTHRMAKGIHVEMSAGYEWVHEKVIPALRYTKLLKDTDRYQRNLVGNAAFMNEEHGIDPAAFVAKVDRCRVRYVEAHRRLVVYNRAQYLARQAAVNLGTLAFGPTWSALFQLKEMLEPLELFDLKVATEFDHEQAGRDLDEEKGEGNWLPSERHDRAWLIGERRFRRACREAWTAKALEYLPGPDGLPLPYPWRS